LVSKPECRFSLKLTFDLLAKIFGKWQKKAQVNSDTKCNFMAFEISDTKCNFMVLKFRTQIVTLWLCSFGDKTQCYGLKFYIKHHAERLVTLVTNGFQSKTIGKKGLRKEKKTFKPRAGSL
jgi:hypothetical protein